MEVKKKVEEQVQLPREYKFKLKPYPHQVDGVKKGLINSQWAYFL